MIDYDDPIVAQLFAEAYRSGLGAEAILLTVRNNCVSAEWDDWSTAQKQDFNRNTLDYFRAYSAAKHAAIRIEQMRERGFIWWIFLCDPEGCDDRFAELNGIALPPSDPFWANYFPLTVANGGYIVGARSESGIRRLGGDPDKSLPDWAVR